MTGITKPNADAIAQAEAFLESLKADVLARMKAGKRTIIIEKPQVVEGPISERRSHAIVGQSVEIIRFEE